ncbi:LysE family translocator [Lutibaculum baratangense]|uniref:Amino acid efflux protein n=1 Tax=Lutibaculum baratangense AMV1 TaxID=631454 RepID=V4R4Q4_9HYPH|nr:LysE family translocator [Lutibaculum baratangense]ESR26907.1 Amino acid efflux protein [Lutibaculum baratangense AMV1]
MEFLPSLPVLAAYVAAVLVLTITPGPDMTLFLGKAVTSGRAAGFAAMLGASSGIFIHTLLVAAGLSALLAASAVGFTVLKVVGAGYLAWLAFDALRNGSGFTLGGTRRVRKESLGRVWLKGLSVNLLNPKIIMFFVTFLPQFVSPQDPAAAQKLVFLGATFVVVSLPVCGAMVASAAGISSFLSRSPRVMRGVDYLFAGIFGAFAVRLLFARPG